LKQPQASYRLLGVDPGTNILGFAILEVSKSKLSVPELGVIRLQQFQDHHQKLRHIHERLQGIIRSFQPEIMAIEAPFFGKNVQSMLKLGRAQGVAIAAAITMDLSVFEYAPRKIKQSITGKGNATKEQVAAMLEHILQIRLDQHTLDATDALAAALCHHYNQNSILGTGRRYKDWSDYVKNQK
jgi:crossover junction endodeoxyribonuclease RuvC